LFTIRILSSAVVFTRSQAECLEFDPWWCLFSTGVGSVACARCFHLYGTEQACFHLHGTVHACFFFSPCARWLLRFLSTRALHASRWLLFPPHAQHTSVCSTRALAPCLRVALDSCFGLLYARAGSLFARCTCLFSLRARWHYSLI
jgi:hypothetical protein